MYLRTCSNSKPTVDTAYPRAPKCSPVGEAFHALARQKECQIIEGHLLPDHVHMCIAIPPKYPVASVIRFLKGKSASDVMP